MDEKQPPPQQMMNEPLSNQPLSNEPLSNAITVLDAQVTQDLELELQGDVEQRIQTAIAEIDMSDANSIIFFGSKAQEQLSTVSDSMLESVRTKDIGPAGNALNTMVARLRDIDVGGLDPNEKPGFFAKLFGIKSEIQKYLDRYSDVREQIDTATDDLERHKTKLLEDIVRLDKLYDANLDYFRTLEVYIAAGRAKLGELDATTIPALAQEVEGGDDVIEVQKLRDLRASRDDLERRVHDLLLTRQVTMQSLPSIRLVQENDKSLVNKINSTIANTVPLWRQQLAQAITIYRSGKAADAVKSASDLTNDLLKSNAETLRTTNAKVREEVERGVFDIETVKQANAELLATIQDSLRIADEGKQRRADAEKELEHLEDELRRGLAAAKSHQTGQPNTTNA